MQPALCFLLVTTGEHGHSPGQTDLPSKITKEQESIEIF